MRVLLINPFYPISETPSPPLGLSYLAGALSAAGIEVEFLDLVVLPYSRNRLQALIESFKPGLIGLTAVTMSFDSAMTVVKDIKAINPPSEPAVRWTARLNAGLKRERGNTDKADYHLDGELVARTLKNRFTALGNGTGRRMMVSGRPIARWERSNTIIF